ncbi:MAG TPA: hypothetical protein DHV01_00610 [Rhodoferax sp.]|nr:hypothetical protein [Rhodoferax sp.]
MGNAICFVSPARYAGSSLTYAKRVTQPSLREVFRLPAVENPFAVRSCVAGARPKVRSRRRAEGPGDTNGGACPCHAASPAKTAARESQKFHVKQHPHISYAGHRQQATPKPKVSNVNSPPSPERKSPCSASPITALLSSPSSCSWPFPARAIWRW